MHPFIGRERLVAEFRQLLRKKSASLVTCQGRRRVGKSRFVCECAKQADHFLSFVGLPPREKQTKQDQLNAFAERLAAQTKAPKLRLDGWPTALQLLASQIPATGSVVVLLDEISWMASGDPDFPGHIKTAFDDLFSPRPGLILVLCGSVSSWIEQNILNNTAFVGRCSWQFRLEPLTLPECAAFFGRAGRRVSAAEKLRILSVTGGIPGYLVEVDLAQTAEQNVERLCFNPGGLLFCELDRIFHDIFTRKAETYRDIVRSLVTGPRNVDRIGRAIKRARGGSLTQALGDLEKAGFIRRDVPFEPRTGESRPRDARFRLADNYLRFHLRYVEPVREQVAKGLYQRSPLETLEAWDTIMGLQFENLVLGSLQAVIADMGLGNVPVLNAAPYVQKKTLRRQGCQIDLLLRTKHSLYVVETKMKKRVGKEIVDEVKQKVATLRLPPTLSVRTGLIYAGELDHEIARSDYFQFLIPAERLLALRAR